MDPRLVKGLSHVLRQHILLAAVLGEVSPKEMSKALGEELNQISYHVKVLRDDCDGLIEETRTVPRRGAIEHYYRANAKTLLPARTWRGLKKGLRAVVGAGQASDLFNDLADALKAGKLQGESDHITRTPLVLDAEGQRNVKAIAARATREVENERRATAKRMKKANGAGGKAVGHTFALLSFEAAWQPADLHTLVARTKGTGVVSANGVNGASHNGGGRKRAAQSGGGREIGTRGGRRGGAQ
ncbi:MAG TPA: winged helix-turn-helix domain-containing protein [Solirubrobacterales bacterium]|nr:winged helix-turn-helix domain-containing protein [Solirubrobacterales bacterium]